MYVKMKMGETKWLVGLWCLTPPSTIFQLYIVVISFIGGGNRSTQRNH